MKAYTTTPATTKQWLLTASTDGNAETIRETASPSSLAQKVYNIIAPWERCDYTPEDIEKEIIEHPAETIAYLIGIIEDLQA